MTRILTLLSLIVAAIICYLAGALTSSIGLILAAVILELMFWLDVFSLLKNRKTDKDSSSSVD